VTEKCFEVVSSQPNNRSQLALERGLLLIHSGCDLAHNRSLAPEEEL
jgi:hypothetical protein